MPGLNATGQGNTADYNIGRGRVYIAELDPTTGLPKAYRFLGNAPEFNVSVETETVEHFSSQSGLRVQDKQVTISQAVNLSFILDELNFQNLADFFSGDTATPTNAAIAGFAEWELVPAGEIVAGRWYDLHDSDGLRAYDVESDDVTIKTTNNVTPVTLVEGTDYTLDKEMGRFFLIHDSAAVLAAISNDDGLDVTLAADPSASTLEAVQALKNSAITVALKFISENAANSDRQTEYQFHQVSLRAEGDLSLIGDEFSQMNFTGAAERNAKADADSPTLTITSVKTPRS